MTRLNLEKEILNKIKKEGITPRPKFFFILKNIFFWFVFVLFVFLGALSFALILYKISGNYQILKGILELKLNISEWFLYFVPYFWTILLFGFLYFAILNYKKTKLFYRINLWIISLISILISVILGVLIFYSGFAKTTDELSIKYLPFYSKYQKIQKIKKKIFLTKMKELGITKKILDNNPKLKEKVQDKFDKNVLGKIYLYRKPNLCLKESFKCQKNEIFFEDDRGCGCREVYWNFEK